MMELANESRLTAAKARDVILSKDSLTVQLTDGRSVSVPLEWYPRLWHGTPSERNNWRLISEGEGIHWSDLDEDVHVDHLVQGKPSDESFRSLKRWLEERAKRR